MKTIKRIDSAIKVAGNLKIAKIDGWIVVQGPVTSVPAAPTTPMEFIAGVVAVVRQHTGDDGDTSNLRPEYLHINEKDGTFQLKLKRRLPEVPLNGEELRELTRDFHMNRDEVFERIMGDCLQRHRAQNTAIRRLARGLSDFFKRLAKKTLQRAV